MRTIFKIKARMRVCFKGNFFALKRLLSWLFNCVRFWNDPKIYTSQDKTETKAIFERKSNTHLKLTSKKSLKNCLATFFKNKNKLKSCCWDENCHFSFEFPQHPNRLSSHFFMVSTCYLFAIVLPFYSNIVTMDNKVIFGLWT